MSHYWGQSKTGNLYKKRKKITEKKRREIKRLYKEGWLQREIAKEMKISTSMVSKIIRDKRR